ncbi:hypothetical protein Aduo_004497 [Ancylostoma duodenale]
MRHQSWTPCPMMLEVIPRNNSANDIELSILERCESSLLAGFLYYSKSSEVDRLSLCTLASLMVLIKLS